MTIGNLINHYNEAYTPYMGSLVNHLPMAQLAIYKMAKDLRKVKRFSEDFVERNSIDKIKDSYPPINTLEEAVGHRDLYQSSLDLIKNQLQREDMDKYIRQILSKYVFGLSSGLFHTSIRLAYAIEGIRMDKSLTSEVERALAYYVTGYREAKLFSRRIHGSNIRQEMEGLANYPLVKDILKEKESLGQKLRAMYGEKDFMERGFTIEGGPEDKTRALLNLLIPAYYFSGNIVALHCLTGLHAIIVLEEYFNDYSLALDILTTSILVHLLTIKYTDKDSNIEDFSHISWDAVLNVSSERTDVHIVKLAYTCYELDRLYNMGGLKAVAIKRIRKNQ